MWFRMRSNLLNLRIFVISCLVCRRYYVAEGVRIYSQETWRQITDNHGRQLVEQHISPTVSAARIKYQIKNK